MSAPKIALFLTPASGNTKAIANVAGKTLIIKGFRVVQRHDGGGVFVAEPSQKSGEKYHPIIEFLDKKVKDIIFDAILKEYQTVSQTQQPKADSGGDDIGF